MCRLGQPAASQQPGQQQAAVVGRVSGVVPVALRWREEAGLWVEGLLLHVLHVADPVDLTDKDLCLPGLL